MSEISSATVTGEVPDGLLDAFGAYERALAANDLAALDAFFAPGPTTLRGDAAGLLVGHEQISAFRGRRGNAPVREVSSVHVRTLDPDHALIVSVNVPRSGGRGLVTQLWVRSDGVWRIDAAQVAAPAPALDSTVWRVVGAPLVQGAVRGPLLGETIAVKDVFAVAGFAVGAGNPAYLAESPQRTRSAAAVQALLDAGASVRGIAQTDEFAYSVAGANAHYGTSPNPAVPGGLPGGSTSGPAAAVALGHASIGLGTDTAGSIRVPASYQGLWGLRTTHGAVSRDGLLPLAPSFDAVGWLARTPELLAAVAATSLDAERQIAPTTGFVLSAELLDRADPGVRAAFDERVEALRGAGHFSEPDVIELGDLDALFTAFRTRQAFEAWGCDGEWIAAHPGAVGVDVASRFDAASRVTAGEAEEALAAILSARARLDSMLEGRILLLPTTSSPAPSRSADAARIESVRAATLSMTCVAGIGGYPAVSAPLLRVGDAPVGLCLVGPRYSDVQLISTAAGWT